MLRTPPTIEKPPRDPSSGRRREEAGTRRRALLACGHRERLHLVAERVGDAPVGQQHPEPEARAGAAVESERLAAVGVVDDAVADAGTGPELGVVDDDPRERLGLDVVVGDRRDLGRASRGVRRRADGRPQRVHRERRREPGDEPHLDAHVLRIMFTVGSFALKTTRG